MLLWTSKGGKICHTTGLTLLLVLGVMALSFQMPADGLELTAELLQKLDGIFSGIIGSVYPPALWMGKVMCEENVLTALLVILAEGLVFAIAAWGLSLGYKKICERLFSTVAAHNYEMEQLKGSSSLAALYKKEFARYFASSIYVTNTIIGPNLAVAFSVAVAVFGMDMIQEKIGLPLPVDKLIPFLLGFICCMMPPSSAAISMEGKQWWIVKTLPVPTKVLLDSKLLLSYSLIAPCYLVSEIVLTIGLKASGVHFLWQLLIPAMMILFGVVFGLFVNLKLPSFDWENEVAVVKQSASTLIGGMGGCLVMLVMGVPVFLVPVAYENAAKGIFVVAVAAMTGILYHCSCKTKLQ